MLNKFNLRNLGENDKIVVKNVLGAFLVKGGSMLVTLFTMPAYIKYFNNDKTLGLWFTILSLLNWILNFDLGIGNGLRNYLSISISKNEREETKKYISSAYFSVGAIVVLLSSAFPFAVKELNLNSFFGISKSLVSPDSLYIATVIVFIGVMVQFLLKLINSVLYALQKSSLNNFLVLVTNVITLLAVLFIPSYSNDVNIIVMATVHALAVVLPLLITTVVVFAGKLRYAIPTFSGFSKKYARKVLYLGGAFFFIQIAYMAIMSSNEYLISHTTNTSNVVDYQVYYRLFSFGSTVFALALTPVWSVTTKAMAEKDYAWVKKTYNRFMKLAFLACVCEMLVVPLMKPLMKLWLGSSFASETNHIVGLEFAVLGCLMIINSVFSSVVNGMGKLKVQAVCFGIGAAVKVPLAFLFVKLLGGWEGVIISNIVSMGIYCAVQPIFLKLFFKKHCK